MTTRMTIPSTPTLESRTLRMPGHELGRRTRRAGGRMPGTLTPIAAFNERFGCDFSDEEFDTIGGMVTSELGHLAEPGEEVVVSGFHFQVSKADARRVHQFAVRVHEA